jgi:L-histidine N-alpha-methyltransferase
MKPTDATPEIDLTDLSPATSTMRADVLAGLRRRPKVLPSQYLYDDKGAVLFEQICEQQEYYPTRTEVAILESQLDDIADAVGPDALVVEPGSGSGIKTRLLLERLDAPVAYVPIDIACEQLTRVAQEFNQTFPDLTVLPVCADFTGDYDLPDAPRQPQRVLAYFPGSTIGNFERGDAVAVLDRLRRLVGDDGGILVGVDTKKDPTIIEPAYDDAAGVSAEFALNYLDRMNRELGADFDRDQFHYAAPYVAERGRIEMGLVSRSDQDVRIGNETVAFAAGEHVVTELSHKYTPDEFADVAADAGLSVAHVWQDPKGWFSVQYLAA